MTVRLSPTSVITVLLARITSIVADFCVANQFRAGSKINVVAQPAAAACDQDSGADRAVGSDTGGADANSVRRMDNQTRPDLRLAADEHPIP